MHYSLLNDANMSRLSKHVFQIYLNTSAVLYQMTSINILRMYTQPFYKKWPHLSSVESENRCQLINIVCITFNYKYDKDSKLKKSRTITLPPKSYAGC